MTITHPDDLAGDLANMSHEIRTPMNVILGYCQLLQREKNLTVRQQAYIHTIADNGDHLLSIIDKVLEMAKIESGQVTMKLVFFKLSSLLQDLELMFQGHVEAKDILVEFHRVGEIPSYILADETKIRQVLSDLLINAIRFTKEGVILVRYWAQDWTDDGVRLVFEVEDTGCGIGPEDQERAFVVFEQVHGGLTSSGIGLGLPISRQYARLMGGDLTLKSEPSKGSTFRFEFQAKYQQKPEWQPLGIRERIVGLKTEQQEFRILLVDDHQKNSQLLAQLLTRVGFHLREAQNWVEAVAAFQEWRPQLALMDMQMLGTDGRKTLQRIKATPNGQDAIVLMISSALKKEDRDSAYAIGVNGFIGKPFEEEEIFKMLQQCLGVQYVYESQESAGRPSVESSGKRLTREMIRALPGAILTAMYAAVATAHMDRFLELIEDSRKWQPQVSAALLSLAEQYDYDTLLELLEKEEIERLQDF